MYRASNPYKGLHDCLILWREEPGCKAVEWYQDHLNSLLPILSFLFHSTYSSQVGGLSIELRERYIAVRWKTEQSRHLRQR